MVAALRAENAELKAENAQLRAQVTELAERVARLERLISRNSGNSSMPPSTDDRLARWPLTTPPHIGHHVLRTAVVPLSGVSTGT